MWSIPEKGLRHNQQIVPPYAVSDTFSNFATLKIFAFLKAMTC